MQPGECVALAKLAQSFGIRGEAESLCGVRYVLAFSILKNRFAVAANATQRRESVMLCYTRTYQSVW